MRNCRRCHRQHLFARRCHCRHYCHRRASDSPPLTAVEGINRPRRATITPRGSSSLNWPSATRRHARLAAFPRSPAIELVVRRRRATIIVGGGAVPTVVIVVATAPTTAPPPPYFKLIVVLLSLPLMNTRAFDPASWHQLDP